MNGAQEELQRSVEREMVRVGAGTRADNRLLVQAMDTALHDLSQPLTSIGLALEVLACEPDPAARKAMLVAAREECARAMRDVEMLRVQTNRLVDGAFRAERDCA